MLSPILDHRLQGLAELPMQLQGKANLEVLLGALLNQVQQLEDVLFPLLSERGLAVAQAGTLDQLGRLVGESRQARQDPEYRAAIGLRIERNNSRGEADRLIRVIKKLTGATTVTLTEPSTGVVLITFDGQSIPSDLRAAMEAIAPVGVRLVLIQQYIPPFAFSSVADHNMPAGAQGFSDIHQTHGGRLSRFI